MKLLILSNFTFFHNVFLQFFSSMCWNEYILMKERDKLVHIKSIISRQHLAYKFRFILKVIKKLSRIRKKLLVTTIFSFSYNIFKSCIFRGRWNMKNVCCLYWPNILIHCHNALFSFILTLGIVFVAFVNDNATIKQSVMLFNPLPDGKILDWFKLKQIADDI